MFRTIKRRSLPGMLASAEANGTSASIINMSSAASSIIGAPSRYAYTARPRRRSIGLTKSVAQDFDYVGKGVRCNAICPGTIESPSLHGRIEELGKTVGGTDKALQGFVDRQPMGRIGSPAEVAALAVYLASDAASFTTGTAIPIDGGWTL